MMWADATCTSETHCCHTAAVLTHRNVATLMPHAWPSKVIHTPKALKPSSHVRRVITVSDTVMLVGRLSCAVEHHTASPQSICSPDDSNSSFHALATVWSSPGDVGMIQQVSAKTRRPKNFFPTSSPHLAHGTKPRSLCVRSCPK